MSRSVTTEIDSPLLEKVAQNVWSVRRRQRYHGVEVGTRMTIFRLGDGLLLHSPVDVARELVEALGPVRWVLAPNLLHHLYLGAWAEHGVSLWGAPGLDEKRRDLRFEGIVREEGEPFGPEVLAIPLRCFSMTNEVILHHRPSRTLVVTDLFFNFDGGAPWFTRWMMRLMGGFPGPKTTVLEKYGMDRKLARQEIRRLLELDFDRVVLSHGAIIPTGGRDALTQAFRWLKLDHR